MALSTAKTYLMYKNATTFVKLADIINYPDLGSTPNKIDTTDLSATTMKTSILGLQEAPDLTFEANFDETAFDLIKGFNMATKELELHFGTAGADAIFQWSGQVDVFVMGGGVDEARKMQIVCSASTAITKKP